MLTDYEQYTDKYKFMAIINFECKRIKMMD